MKKSLLFLIFFIGLATANANSNVKPIDPKKEKKILEIILNQLKARHIIDKKLDDNFSKKVFKTYLDSIDKFKIFFLQSDIAEFKKYETQLDDQLKASDLSFFYLTYDRIKIRMTEGKELCSNASKNGINILEPGVKFDQKMLSYKKNKYELINIWKLFAKGEIANRIAETCIQENDKNKLNRKDFDEAFNDATKYYSDNFLKRIEVSTLNIDSFSRLMFFEEYMNAIINQFDTHSKYYIPRSRDEYLIKETGKIEGIGVLTAASNNFTIINSMVVGGPAWKTKKLDDGDVILKIAQENEPAVDVVGFALYDVAKLTRGKSGTSIKMTVKKANGSIETVSIKRGLVSSNDSYIKSCLVERNSVKYAILSFPRFYTDYDDDQVRNVVDDFADELQILKECGVQGLVIDIRNNGGGSVEAATKIISNFIDKSAVLQYKNKDNKTFKFESETSLEKWNKSVVLLVNNETASAAEIFASAFQEFNIGVILGRQTFGKGTIQEILDLNMFNAKKDEGEDFGSLKICTQRFYKLNGKSVQNNGIIPDVDFPLENEEDRENLRPNSLVADKVGAVELKKINNDEYFKKIIKNSQERILSKDYFGALRKAKKEELVFKLETFNFDKFQNDLFKFIDNKNKIIPAIPINPLEFKSTPADVKLFKRREYLISKRKEWYAQLKTDVQIAECLNVLQDIYTKE